MANWFIPEGSIFVPYDDGPVSIVALGADAEGTPPSTIDALSAPTREDLLPQALALLPRGAAWRSPDDQAPDTTSRMAGFWRGVLAGFADLYSRAYTLSLESTSATLVHALDDWEAEYGLPDDCLGEDPSTAARLRSLRQRVQSQTTITPADFVRLAAAAGYEVVVEEPIMFEAGVSSCGWGDGHEVGSPANEYYWLVRPLEVPDEFFTAGESSAGWDRIYDYAVPDELICLFERLRPAWTRIIWNYDNFYGLLNGYTVLLGLTEAGTYQLLIGQVSTGTTTLKGKIA